MNRWKDWYDQGKRDLEKAQLDLKYGFYEWACFTSQQASEKIIKALGMKAGITLWGHSLTEMINLLAEKIIIPEEIKEKAKLLDLYYIPPRYPNGFASGKPADYFSEKQAKEALDAANSIIRFCESYLAR
ncbi:MAG: HEPN domain-containing protein [Candidatus Aminicenantes bacterium]|nr:HEPN domain-containing protein [Candidatus Aminicenantes bacterium]